MSKSEGDVILKLGENFKVSQASHVSMGGYPGSDLNGRGVKMSMEDVGEVMFRPALESLLVMESKRGTLPIKDGQIAALVLVIADPK